MERWSARLPDGRAVHAGFGLELPKGDPWERIAAYEDTGLTPEDITAAADRRHNCKIECLLEKYNKVIEERDTLKKAYSMACERIEHLEKMSGGESTAFEIERTFIQQAQEQEGKDNAK